MINTIIIILSSFLYSLALTEHHLWILVFVSLILFFHILNKATSYKAALLNGFTWGIFTAAFMSRWMINTLTIQYEQTMLTAIIFEVIAVILPGGILYAFFSLTANFFRRKNIIFMTITLPSLWVLFDYLKEIIPIFIPWGLAPYSLTKLINYIQILDITGIYGLDFIIASICSTAVYLCALVQTGINHPENFKKHKIVLSSSLIILFITIPLIYGRFRLNNFMITGKQEQAKNQYHCKIIQGNFDPRSRWMGNTFKQRLDTYLNLTQLSKNDNPTLNIWPETVLNSNNSGNKLNNDSIYAILNQNNSLLSGGTRQHKGKIYNSAFYFSTAANRRIQYYDKKILLPFAETSFSGLGLNQFYTAPSSFSKGNTSLHIETESGRAGISICLEILYPDLIRKAVANNAMFLINIANDSWFGYSPEPGLHFNAAIFRAIENRRYVLRAANTGYSGIISPDGSVEKKSDLFKREILAGDFIPSREKTFYSEYGNLIIFLSLLIIFSELIIIAVRE